MKYDYDFVCIGSGPAGQRGAVQAAKLGKKVAVIERRRKTGGVCIETGTIPSKTFREAVIRFTQGQSAGQRGMRPIRRPAITDLMGQVTDVVERETSVVEHQLRRNDIDLYCGTASFCDAHTIAVASGNEQLKISTANTLIASGTRPAQPPGVPVDGKTVVNSDMIMCLEELPRSLAVVGGGVIGFEYASMFAALGVEVTLIDRSERPLEFIDREIVDELIYQMRAANVIFRLGEAVEKIEVVESSRRQGCVLLQSGKRIVADLVLYAVGRQGCTDELALQAAGLEADKRGRLAVDDQFQTSVPGIYAAGDVIGYPSLAATSSEQGRIAACYALGVETRGMAPYFPIGIYAIPEISMAGDTEQRLTADKVPYEIGIARYREIARGSILGDNSGFLKLIFHRNEEHRLLGVHIIGTGATELLHIGQAVLRLGGGLDYFLRTVFNYPTLAECYKVAALDASNKLAVNSVSGATSH